jgi:hypothetical protein
LLHHSQRSVVPCAAVWLFCLHDVRLCMHSCGALMPCSHLCTCARVCGAGVGARCKRLQNSQLPDRLKSWEEEVALSLDHLEDAVESCTNVAERGSQSVYWLHRPMHLLLVHRSDTRRHPPPLGTQAHVWRKGGARKMSERAMQSCTWGGGKVEHER